LIEKYWPDDLLRFTVNNKKENVYNVIFKNFINWWEKDDR
jgi:hypothetical protein